MKRHLGVLLTVVGTALAFLAVASAAQATPPAAPYQDFAGCPSPAEDDTVAFCLKTVTDGGHIQFGKKNVPITNPIVLRGGLSQLTGSFVANSEGGIVPVRQTVEGGLVGLTGLSWLDEALAGKEQLKVYAVVELAGQPSSLLELPFSLPIKIHLENAVLGNSCYVGSNENPIQLNLTTGTTNPPAPNTPISGQEFSELAPEAGRPEVLTGENGIFVDNSYAVPKANGCVLNIGSQHYNIDWLVNAATGLPAAAGTNTTVQDFDISVVSPQVVYP